MDSELFIMDYFRLGLFTALYCLLFLVGVAIIDVWTASRKIVLVLQSLFTFLIILTSGAVIPTLYFPQVVQGILPYLFSYISLNWLIDIVLEGQELCEISQP